MTVNELMKSALALCGEGAPAPYLSAFGVPWVNALMAENFETEQNIRRAVGRPALEKIPVLTALSEEVPYDEGLVNSAFVFGLAAFIADAGCDRELASSFRNRYMLGVQTAAKAFEHAIFDCYGEE